MLDIEFTKPSDSTCLDSPVENVVALFGFVLHPALSDLMREQDSADQ